MAQNHLFHALSAPSIRVRREVDLVEKQRHTDLRSGRDDVLGTVMAGAKCRRGENGQDLQAWPIPSLNALAAFGFFFAFSGARLAQRKPRGVKLGFRNGAEVILYWTAFAVKRRSRKHSRLRPDHRQTGCPGPGRRQVPGQDTWVPWPELPKPPVLVPAVAEDREPTCPRRCRGAPEELRGAGPSASLPLDDPDTVKLIAQARRGLAWICVPTTLVHRPRVETDCCYTTNVTSPCLPRNS